MNYKLIGLYIGICLMLFPTSVSAGFPDVPTTHPNAPAIEYLQSRGVISGAEDGKFYPDNVVSRAELLKMVFRTKGITPSSPGNSFPDVPADAWFAPYVEEALNQGIVSGYPDGLFRPHQVVSRIEALKITFNTFEDIPLSTSQSSFSDVLVSDWYAPYVEKAHSEELMDTNGSEFEPTRGMSRKEIAELIYRYTKDEYSIPVPDLTYSSTVFPDVQLTRNIPSHFTKNEWYAFEGTLLKNADTVSIVFVQDDANRITCTGEVTDSNNFYVPCHIDTVGTFQVGIFGGYAGALSNETFTVVDGMESPNVSQATNADTVSLSIEDNDTIISWNNNEKPISKLNFQQAGKSQEVLLSNFADKWTVDYTLFKDFSEGPVTLSLRLADSVNSGASGITTSFSAPVPTTFDATKHHYSEVVDTNITIDPLPWTKKQNSSLQISGTTRREIDNVFIIIEPDMEIKEYMFIQNMDTLSAGQSFSHNLTLSEKGSYIIEINGTDGFAVVNRPVYVGDVYPLLPDFVDLYGKSAPVTSDDLATQRSYLLGKINETRANYGVEPVYIDTSLNEFAQAHSTDMAENLFVGHTGTDGRGPNDRKTDFNIKTPTGENVALSYDLSSAHEGLMRSASHLQNIIDPDWTRVGIGIKKGSDGYFYVTHEFSTRDIIKKPFSNSEIMDMTDTLVEKINFYRSRDLEHNEELSDDILDWLEGSRSKTPVTYFAEKGYSDFLVVTATALYYPDALDELAQNEELQKSSYDEVGIGIMQNDDELEFLIVFLK